MNGKTPLHLAAQCGQYSSLATLVQHCNEDISNLIDHQGCTILHWACHKGKPDCVEYLVDNFNNRVWKGNLFTPIHCSVLQGSEKCLDILLNYFGKGSIGIRDQKGAFIAQKTL